GAVVARVVVDDLVAAHILRLAVVERGDHVPGGAAVRHQVERGEHARHMERLVVGGRIGGAEAKPLGRHAHHGEHRDGVELHAADAVRDRVGVVAAVHVGHRQAVVEEAEVEFALLQHAADVPVEVGRPAVGARGRMTPRARDVGAVLRLQEPDQDHPAHRGFRLVPSIMGGTLHCERAAGHGAASHCAATSQSPQCGRRARLGRPTTIIGETAMREDHFDRRTVLAATTALGAAALMPSLASAQGTAPAAGSALPARGEFVVRGAHVLTMDPNLGDLVTGDVHVRDGAIVAVGVSLAAPGAEAIDGKGMICLPGFVDTHWHHWTTLLRPVMQADDPKRTYFPVTFALGLHYTPEDSYRSVRLGLAQALAAGVTTTHNWAHNVRSPAHADAEVRAMRDGGLRGRFAYGPALGMANDKPMDLADVARLKKEIGNDPMLTLGICSRNVDGNTGGTRGAIDAAMARKEWSAARELGLPITLHTSGTGAIKLLNEAGLLGLDLQL